MLKKMLQNNPNALTAWMFWEEDAFDGKDADYVNALGHDQTGRFIPLWSLDASGNFVVEPVIDYDKPGDFKDSLDDVFQKGENAIFEPFTYELGGKDVDMTSIVSPIKLNGKTIGMIGIDISLASLNERVNNFLFYETGVVGITSNTGYVIAHQHSQLNGQNYFDSGTMDDPKDNDRVKKAMQVGERAVEGYSSKRMLPHSRQYLSMVFGALGALLAVD